MSSYCKLIRPLVVAMILVNATGFHALGQSSGVKTPEDMAKAIAYTIDTTTAKVPRGPIVFQGATAHHNIVEIRYAINDNGFFAGNRDAADKLQTGNALYFCNENRISYLQGGVVIHIVLVAPDKQQNIEITIDKSTCAKIMPPTKKMDDSVLSQLAETAVEKENSGSARSSRGPIRFSGASAHGSTIEEDYVVLDASAMSITDANRKTIVEEMKGYFCTQHQRLILDGITFQEVFDDNGSRPILHLTIDRKSC